MFFNELSLFSCTDKTVRKSFNMTLYFVKEFNIMWISAILPNYIIFGGNRKFLLTYLHYLQIKASLKAFNYRTMRKIDLLH